MIHWSEGGRTNDELWVELPLFRQQVTLQLAGAFCLCWFVLDYIFFCSCLIFCFLLFFFFFLPFLSHGWWPICLIIIFKQSSKKQKNIVWWIFNIKSLLTMNCYWVRYNLSKWHARFSCDITQIRTEGWNSWRGDGWKLIRERCFYVLSGLFFLLAILKNNVTPFLDFDPGGGLGVCCLMGNKLCVIDSFLFACLWCCLQ